MSTAEDVADQVLNNRNVLLVLVCFFFSPSKVAQMRVD